MPRPATRTARLVDDSADAVVLTGVGSDIGQDAELVDVGVVFWVEAFYFRIKGCVGRVADRGVSKVGPFLSVVDISQICRIA